MEEFDSRPVSLKKAFEKIKAGKDCIQIVSKILFQKQHKTPVRKIRFSTSGDQIFSLTRNKTLTCWDSATGRKARVIRRITDTNARPYW
uniref:Uncharacterized protein n=1 Tax=Romanomermis culicivorax TaxID=13658 RepID=A0A915JV84_ROMCU